MSAVKAPFFRTPYNYDTKAVSNECVVKNDGPSLTVQSMTDDADLNKILAKYQIGGKMPENPRIPVYGDFSGVHDFQSAIEAVVKAQDDFMAMPADVRSRFKNDPQLLLEFLSKPDNVDEAIKLNLLNENAVANRKAYLEKSQAERHAELLAAAKAAGLKFEAAEPPAPSKT